MSSIKIKKITRTTLSKPIKMYDVIDANPLHNFIVATDNGFIVMHNCGLLDEI